MFLVRRLSKLPALWVYFPFLASLVVFVWTKEPLWFSQIPGRLLFLRKSPFSSVRYKLATKLRRKVARVIAVFNEDGDDKLVDAFSIHSAQPLE